MSRKLSGLKAWVIQRISALYLALFTLGVIVPGWWAPPLDYAHWRSAFLSSGLQGATGLFFLALLFHAWVGGRDIILDYIKPLVLRFMLLLTLATGLLAIALWVATILIKLGLR